MSLLDAAGLATGDIWSNGAFSFESPLKDLLDSGEYSLEQLLAEDELLQELRGVHPQLIEFFSTEEAVAGLVRFVTLPLDADPPKSTPASAALNGQGNEKIVDENAESEEVMEGGEDKEDYSGQTQQNEQAQHDAVHVRYPYMACEVICCEIKGVIDILVDGLVPTGMETPQSEGGENDEVTLKDPRSTSMLDLLFSLLYDSKAGEVDDYRAGYFDKILSVLFRKRPQAMSEYINEGGTRGSEALMQAMFNHLYSHSIMQIVQRLLLPQPPSPTKSDSDDENDGDDLYSDPLDVIDEFGSFRCNWSESPFALTLLLDCLIGTRVPDIADDEERRLSLFQNASEILITIIQNSPLTSPTLHVLTANPVLERLIVAATCLDEGGAFGPHDSKLTCTMNVLESLILQLGGYGSVGTVLFPEDDDDLGLEEETSEAVERKEVEASAQSSSMQQELATSETLISHLPMMLSSLCQLLQYPDAENWVSPMQFSRGRPQKLLGSSRLRIVRLLESLVLLGDPTVDFFLCDSNCLEICLDLFWRFQWCSMLHQSVANLLVHVFEGANTRSELQSYFLVKCNLLGRLMDSFWEGGEEVIISGTAESDARLSEAVMAMKSINADVRTSSVESERGSFNSKDDVLPVSDDDVSAALEKSSELHENGPADPAPAQSFRLGYMGHVIIICQALVHACANDGGGSEARSDGDVDSGEPEMNGELLKHAVKNSMDEQESSAEERVASHDALERGQAGDSVETNETLSNALILAQLVDTHPLKNRWQVFVTTTLASETAIQSTPLGGFAGSSGGMEPLHSHRPGLEDDGGYDEDDGAAPPVPPRGLCVGGDVIDMDDNDLDVAASMMAGLSLGRGAVGDADNRNGADLLASIPQQGSGAQSGGYIFDDPLGDGRFGKFDDDEDGDSSDEESGLPGNATDSGGGIIDGVAGKDAPVMDLFAGNFDSFGDKQDATGQQSDNWSDFANFDDAFAGARDGRNGEPSSENPAFPSNGNTFDDVFGDGKDHAMLLEELDKVGSQGKVTHESDIGDSVVLKVNSMEEAVKEEPVFEGGEGESPEALPNS